MALLERFGVEVVIVLFGTLVHRIFVYDDVGYDRGRLLRVGIMTHILTVELLQELCVQLLLFVLQHFWELSFLVPDTGRKPPRRGALDAAVVY